jgi:endonuclease YncB( thermonuclease family)
VILLPCQSSNRYHQTASSKDHLWKDTLADPLETVTVTTIYSLGYNNYMNKLASFRMPILLILLFALTTLISIPVWAGITAEVVAISSGDTITILKSNNTERVIKLTEIEAPEPGQPYYEKAKQALADKVLKKTISFERVAWDMKGQPVGKVTLNGEYISAWLVEKGHVWVYRDYSDDPRMLELEAGAQKNKLGLWALPPADRVPPWEWILSPSGRDSE